MMLRRQREGAGGGDAAGDQEGSNLHPPSQQSANHLLGKGCSDQDKHDEECLNHLKSQASSARLAALS